MSYYLFVAATMLVLPLLLTVGEFTFYKKDQNLFELTGKWFIFWAVGVRLLVAGVKQALDPAFTGELLQIPDSGFIIIRELGFANIIFGALGVISLFNKNIRLAATAGGFFLGLAGAFHIFRLSENENFKETIAMISDLWIFIIVLIYSFGHKKFV